MTNILLPLYSFSDRMVLKVKENPAMNAKTISFLLILLAGIYVFGAPVLYTQEKGTETQQEEMQKQQDIDLDIENPKVSSTDEQQNQLRGCLETAHQLLTKARTIREATYQPDFNIDDIREQFIQLKNRMKTLKDQNAQFMQSLSDDQKILLQDSLEIIKESQKILKSLLENLDKEFEKIEPDRKQIFHYFEEIENSMQDWILGYRGIEIAMNLEPMYEE